MAILNVIEGLCSICVLFMFYFGACVLFCVLFFATFFGQLAFLLISVLIRSLQLLAKKWPKMARIRPFRAKFTAKLIQLGYL